LSINSTGVTTFEAAIGSASANPISGGTALISLSTNAGGSLVMNGGAITTTGAQSYGEAITLGADTVLRSTGLNGGTGGRITLANPVNGAFALEVNTTGTTRFEGDVGQQTALSSLTTDAGGMVLIDASAIHTSGPQIFNEMVSLLQSTSFTGSHITFNAAVMGASDMRVVGATTLNTSSVNTTGRQTYSGPVTLAHDVILTAVGDLTFDDLVDGAHALVANASGTTIFNGSVGSATPLASLVTDAQGSVEIHGGRVTTTGAQTYGEAMTLGADATFSSTAAGSISFSSRIDTHANAVSAKSLTVNTTGLTNFSGAVGAQLPLSRLITDAGGTVHVQAGQVNTTGNQSYGDAVILDSDTRLNTSQGTIEFVSITDAGAGFNLDMLSATQQTLAQVQVGGALHVTTQAGGVTQQAGTHLEVGGLATFTADVGTLQVADLTSADNRFGMNLPASNVNLKLTQTNGGSWANVSVTTQGALNLDDLQSAGTVTLDTRGALTTRSISTFDDLVINSHGSAVTLGDVSVLGHLDLRTEGGNLAQTGPLTVTLNASVNTESLVQGEAAGSIALDYMLYDNTQNPPVLVSSNTFGGTLSIQGHSTSVAAMGDLQLATVHNTGPMTLRAPAGLIDLGSAFITDGDLTLVSRDDMNLGGADIRGDLHMTSTAGSISFGTATVQGDLTAVTQGGAVDLGAATVGRHLDVQTQGGDITQSAVNNAFLTVGGDSNLNASTGNVTLPNLPNQFAGPIRLHAHDVVLAGSNGLILGDSTVTGALNVTAVTGDVTQQGALHVTGPSTLRATQGDVILEDDANTFMQDLVVNAINTSIHASTDLILGASAITGDLSTKVGSGDITQTGPLTVVGKSEFVTTAGNVDLTNPANVLGDVVDVQTSGALSLTTAGPLTMGQVTAQGNADLKSTGVLNLGSGTYGSKLKANSGGSDILQSGPIKFVGDTDFDAGSAKIDLFNPNNLWTGILTFKGGLIMINHPVLMNAVSAGTLVVRVETSIPVVTKAAGGATTTVASAPAGSAKLDVSVSTVRQASANESGLITVALSAEAAAVGRSFSINMAEHIPEAATPNAQPKVTQVDGKPLPDWLKFDPSTKTFTATQVPAGAFPLQLKVGVGATEAIIVIQHSQEVKN
jgi:hypothetical protein